MVKFMIGVSGTGLLIGLITMITMVVYGVWEMVILGIPLLIMNSIFLFYWISRRVDTKEQ